MVTPETIEQFRIRIAKRLDEHFARFAEVAAAINAGMEKTNNRARKETP